MSIELGKICESVLEMLALVEKIKNGKNIIKGTANMIEGDEE
jgi:hypothetical protein